MAFQAVDLDAVLDEFEQKQDEQETSIPEKILENGSECVKAVNEGPRSPASCEEEFFDVAESLPKSPVTIETDIERLKPVDNGVTVPSPQPDVLLGVENVKDEPEVKVKVVPAESVVEDTGAKGEEEEEDVVEQAETNVVTSKGASDDCVEETDEVDSSSESSSNTSSASESIYDKYRSREDDDSEEDDEVPKNKDVETKDPHVPYLQPDPSTEEMEEMLNELEELNVAESQVSVAVAAPSPVVSSEQGARPKDKSLMLRNDNEEDHEGSEAFGKQDQPDLVIVARKRVKSSVVPADSPPPYSEVDPMIKKRENLDDDDPTEDVSQEEIAKPVPDRPTSLDVEPREVTPESEEVPKIEIEESEIPASEETDLEPQIAPVVGPPGSTPANPNGPNESGIPELLQGLSEDQLMLGKITPYWIPDADALNCMICDSKFTIVKRRHHCRACGRVLCSVCCSEKHALQVIEGKVARVCKPCKGILERLDRVEKMMQEPESEVRGAEGGAIAAAPSTSTPIPAGVLKRSESGTPSAGAVGGTSASSNDPKQVMFSGGIRPGGDLAAELDGTDESQRPKRRSSRTGRKKGKPRNGDLNGETGGDPGRSLIPDDGLPFVAGQGAVDPADLIPKFEAGECVSFSLNANLRVYVTLVKNYAPVHKALWNYRTRGLNTVGQDEVVVLLVKEDGEILPSRQLFQHLQMLYENAVRGSPVGNMGFSNIDPGEEFLGDRHNGGFLYIRHTFQSIDGLDLPPQQPYLFGLLINWWEIPWARVFPLRLMLRLGAECRYYPCPLWSIRNRKRVYREIGNTIMKLLSDFRNFTYSLPIIRGLVIHMEDKLTTVIIPKSSSAQIQKALQNSNDPVLPLGANFSTKADSHLVAVQREEDDVDVGALNNSDYETQAINIANKVRNVTGASFIVLNGALKSAAGLTAKSSIIEDGIMVQVSQDRMIEIRKQLSKMENVTIDCGPVGAESPDETVLIKWMDRSQMVFNTGVKSFVDGRPMDGINSVRMIHSGSDFFGKNHMIRWTETFIIPDNKDVVISGADQTDPTRIASIFAKAICTAMKPHMKLLKKQGLSPFAVKISLDPENVGYEAGSQGSLLSPEFMENLDNELVPLLHGQATPSQNSFELVFHVLDV